MIGMKMIMAGIGVDEVADDHEKHDQQQHDHKRIATGRGGDPSRHHRRAAQIGEHPAENRGGADGDHWNRIEQARQAPYHAAASYRQLSSGIATNTIYATAITPASVGVNWPVRMPPMMMIGIISGTAACLVALVNWPNVARLCFKADRPEEVTVDHQPDADE